MTIFKNLVVCVLLCMQVALVAIFFITKEYSLVVTTNQEYLLDPRFIASIGIMLLYCCFNSKIIKSIGLLFILGLLMKVGVLYNPNLTERTELAVHSSVVSDPIDTLRMKIKSVGLEISDDDMVAINKIQEIINNREFTDFFNRGYYENMMVDIYNKYVGLHIMQAPRLKDIKLRKLSYNNEIFNEKDQYNEKYGIQVELLELLFSLGQICFALMMAITFINILVGEQEERRVVKGFES